MVCALLPSRDLTIFMDIEINPGPTGITGSPSISVRNINLLSTSVLASCFHTRVSYSRSELINLRPAYKRCFCKPILNDLKNAGLFKYRGKRAGHLQKKLFQERRKISVIISFRSATRRSLNIQVHTSSKARDLTNTIKPRICFDTTRCSNGTLNSGSFILASLNARSVKNKVEGIIDHVLDNKIDFCSFIETWLTNFDSVTISSLSFEGYVFQSFPRQSLRRGGGTGILHRDSLKCVLLDGRELKSFEYSEWSVKLQCKTLRVIIVYRPPYSPQHQVSSSVFFEEFSTLLENTVLCLEPLLIVGDFNFHLDDHQNADTRRFCHILTTFGLQQHVSVPTHVSGHTLDL